jgi:hypothetical protein
MVSGCSVEGRGVAVSSGGLRKNRRWELGMFSDGEGYLNWGAKEAEEGWKKLGKSYFMRE